MIGDSCQNQLYSRVTTEGRPSGTNATRIDTANVTVAAAWPLYAVVIPMAKNTTAKTMAIIETIMTNRPLVDFISIAKVSREEHTSPFRGGFCSPILLLSAQQFDLQFQCT